MPTTKDRAAVASAPARGAPKARLEFGRRWLAARDASRLDVGSVVELDCPADECVEVYAGGRLLARGEAVVVDAKLGIRVRETAAVAR